jgi:hypothetical protein
MLKYDDALLPLRWDLFEPFAVKKISQHFRSEAMLIVAQVAGFLLGAQLGRSLLDDAKRLGVEVVPLALGVRNRANQLDFFELAQVMTDGRWGQP